MRGLCSQSVWLGHLRLRHWSVAGLECVAEIRARDIRAVTGPAPDDPVGSRVSNRSASRCQAVVERGWAERDGHWTAY